MRVVDQQMLKEENRVERRDKLDGHQVLVGRQGLRFAADRRVASQPLQEGLLFLAAISLQILHVALVALLLTRMWRTELLGLVVGPRHLDVGQLEGHLWSQGTDAPQERIGGLEAIDVSAVQALHDGGLVHFGHVRRHILQQHALAVSELHVCWAAQGSQEGADVGLEIS